CLVGCPLNLGLAPPAVSCRGFAIPIRTAIWKVAAQPEPLAESSLAKEQGLEAMIVAAPRLVSDEWMLIGRQEDTGFGGRNDLLAIAPDGSLVLIELKRNRTPREVVAQALDYASWVAKLRPEQRSEERRVGKEWRSRGWRCRE